MKFGTFSVDSKAWLGPSRIEFYTDIIMEPSVTSSSSNVHNLNLITPESVKQYLIKMEKHEGFHILLEDGNRFSSYDNGTYLISENQLRILKKSDVPFTIISESSVSMRDYYTQIL